MDHNAEFSFKKTTEEYMKPFKMNSTGRGRLAVKPQALISGRIGKGMGDYTTLGDMEVPHRNIDGMWETVDQRLMGLRLV